MTQIQLVLTDDWELYGDGSGHMRHIQFDTMRKLVAIYDSFGIKGSFNIEVMQQLGHLQHGQDHPNLLALAQEWEAIVKEMYAKGHDMQLHIHPQWHNAQFADGTWQLTQKWSMLDYSYEEALSLLQACKQYLESVLQPLQPDYRCEVFRSGSWCLAPSEHLLSILADLGIRCDISIARGIYFDIPQGQLDYREVDEPLLPYYPQMQDARRLSSAVEPIVCVPTHSVQWGIGSVLFNVVKKLVKKLNTGALPEFLPRYILPPDATPIPNSGLRQDYYQQQWGGGGQSKLRKLAAYLQARKDRVSDLSALSYLELRAVVQDIRRRAQASGWPVVPIVLENHTKNIGDFRPIETFCAYIAQSSDIEVITARELADHIASGLYPIRRAEAPHSVRTRTELMRHALQTRLSEVLSQLNGADRSNRFDLDNQPADDPEETLRVVMVRLLPRVKNSRATQEEKAYLFAQLDALYEMSISDDLRFIDTWNNAYEGLHELVSSDRDIGDHFPQFLQRYAVILETRLKNIS